MKEHGNVVDADGPLRVGSYAIWSVVTDGTSGLNVQYVIELPDGELALRPSLSSISQLINKLPASRARSATNLATRNALSPMAWLAATLLVGIIGYYFANLKIDFGLRRLAESSAYKDLPNIKIAALSIVAGLGLFIFELVAFASRTRQSSIRINFKGFSVDIEPSGVPQSDIEKISRELGPLSETVTARGGNDAK